MAAVLCGGCENLFKGGCNACGEVCKLPCTICSKGCELTGNLCSNSFCIYIVVALSLNIPPIYYALGAIGNVANCKGSQWLTINMIICIAHIVAAIYLAKTGKTVEDMKQMLCYDPWIAAYILVGIGSFVWLCTGTSWRGQELMEEGDNCPDDVSQLAKRSIQCGFAFLALGCSALFLSMACLCCRGKRTSTTSVVEPSSQQVGVYTPPHAATVA